MPRKRHFICAAVGVIAALTSSVALGELAARHVMKAHPAAAIGSYPFFDAERGPNTNIVVRSRDPASLAAAKAAVEDMLRQVKATRK